MSDVDLQPKIAQDLRPGDTFFKLCHSHDNFNNRRVVPEPHLAVSPASPVTLRGQVASESPIQTLAHLPDCQQVL